MAENEKKEETKKQFSLVEVPTQHTIAVQTVDGNIMSVDELMVQIANDVSELKKLVAG